MKHLIQRIKQKTVNANNHVWITLLFAILILPNIVVMFRSSDLSGNTAKQLEYFIFSSLLLLLPALFLKLRWYFIFESIFMLCAPFEIGYVWLYKSTVTDGFISSVLNTNVGEAAELLLTMKWQCLSLLLVWTGYFVTVFKKIKNSYLFTGRFSVLAGLTAVLFNLSVFGKIYATEYKDNKQAKMKNVREDFIDNYKKTYPCNMITLLARKYDHHVTLKNMPGNIASFSYHAKKSPPLPDRETYVVVIGESARYGNFSINGYGRKTSPQLEKIKDLLTYSDVYATSNVTEFALPLLLSRATPLHFEKAYREKTFADAFREAGFHTGWVANQSGYHPYVKRIAKDIDRACFPSDEFETLENYDNKLLPCIDSLLNENRQKTFLVVHTLGSHFRYNFRYPKLFEKFTPALEGTNDYAIVSDKNRELFTNTYDNSILYTDYILSEIIGKVASRQGVSAVLYISDHAENLYDHGQNTVLHGSKTPPVPEIHVPLFIWTSPAYRDAYPGKQHALEANRDKKISASNIFHSILDMADIHYPGETPGKSIASDRFREDSIRHVYTANKEVIHFQ
ncbi:MAG: phosphoethanolamine transferase [Tannerella sp.]|jgi:glucan phosphoethanolaminetransferase (alkaline phosphatase superfamily)|nr:phosphoethanolamine transferase [Tannerella sp.]